MFNKLDQLSVLIIDKSPDIVLICETWNNSSISNAMLNISGYYIEPELRLDREDTANGIGGGLIVYVKNSLSIKPNPLNCPFNQFCRFNIIGNKNDFEVILFYRSPNSPSHNNEKLIELINHSSDNCLIIGDLNIPSINWTSHSCPPRFRDFLQCTEEKNLSQLVNFASHERGATLDVALTNKPEKFVNISPIGYLGSDHTMISIDVFIEVIPPKTTERVPDWSSADKEGLADFLSSIKWSDEMNDMSTEQVWTFFKETIHKGMSTFVPFKTRRDNRSPPWYNKRIKNMVRKKQKLWDKYRQLHTQESFSNYKLVEKKCKKAIASAKKRLEKNIANSNDQRPFFMYVKGKTKSRTNIGPLKVNDSVLTSNKDMATALNNFFSSVFTRESHQSVPDADQHIYNDPITSCTFPVNDIIDALDKLKPTSASGPDGIPGRLLKDNKHCLSIPLAIIFTKSLASGSVPSDWREANVTPIFKKGSKSDPSNYRPISLTSIPCKIMEAILKKNIVKHLDVNELLLTSQHGFRSNRSTTTSLLSFFEDITAEHDEGNNVDLLYLDFAKAFDKVPHLRLIQKLIAHGIKGQILEWIKSWLRDRQQKTVLNGESSQWSNILSGVVQGSVLGPLLFLIFINDLDAAAPLLNYINKFADDTKVGHRIASVEDRDILQASINLLHDWSVKWGMSFNVSKCHIMHLGRTNPRYNYTMDGQTIPTTNEEKDIGVIVTDTLKPSRHCAEAARRATTILYQISKAFHYRDRHIFVKLYTTYVRCHLEYASPAWSPRNQGDIETLEKVQKRMVSMIPGLQGDSYEEKLRELHLMSLESRRNRTDMVTTYKILTGIDNVDHGTWFETYGNSNRLTRNSSCPLNIVPKHARTDIRAGFFSQRVVNQWNNLPSTIKLSPSIASFKRAYDAHQAR